MLRPLDLAHELLEAVIEVGDTVVDATMGQGYDTVFLAKLGAKVVAFDVQAQALEMTQALLEKGNVSAELILSGHEHVTNYVKVPIKAGIFNLGYLPKSDKQVITHAETTLQALESLLDLLVKGGRIAVMIYYGHEGGIDERDAVVDFVSALPQQTFQVMQYGSLNQVNQPPFLVMIEKR
ncbi:tRNA (mnm(5)s(2)U34)-methyltransferase [Lactococcus insecticola]|uniref:SAM-dependent methyltransferase n=1 Tax=Pseudolactococcus insecticola TaxID=2709158 RepID=A0A6A0B7S9_9LACT|nr:class I SAM-dependent methyltransferase [Lactococcus insecticola]GFH41352.1 SAM-dependent methyltransferase [Lactococcus insecticola]